MIISSFYSEETQTCDIGFINKFVINFILLLYRKIIYYYIIIQKKNLKKIHEIHKIAVILIILFRFNYLLRVRSFTFMLKFTLYCIFYWLRNFFFFYSTVGPSHCIE